GPSVAREARLPGSGHGADPARGVDHAQRVAAPLADVEVAHGVERDRARIDERLGAGLAAVPGHALFAVAGDGRHDPGLQVDGADAPVVEVADIEDAVPEGNGVDTAEARLERGPPVAREALLAGAREHGQAAVASAHADTITAHLDDIEVPALVEGHAERLVQSLAGDEHGPEGGDGSGRSGGEQGEQDDRSAHGPYANLERPGACREEDTDAERCRTCCGRSRRPAPERELG